MYRWHTFSVWGSASRKLPLPLGNTLWVSGKQNSLFPLRQVIKGLFTWKWGTPEQWGTSPTRGKEILVFTCNPGCVVAKHAYKHRTIVCSDKAAFHFNVVVAGKTLVWFHLLAWLSDSMLKLSPALSISSAFWWFWRWNHQNNLPCSSDLITPVRRVRKLSPLKQVTQTGWPGNPPWWGTTPNMWTGSRKKRDTVEPQFNERLFNEVLHITNEIFRPG